jgi:protein-S-isoprenylcysteine O-methyltransferase Ste14
MPGTVALRTGAETARYNGVDMSDQIVIVASVACWGSVLAVWLAGALYNARHAPKARIRTESRQVMPAVATFLACSIVLFFGRGIVQNLVVDAAWVRFLGLAVLIASTVFALWARFSLGTSWSMAPEVGGDRRLRTRGPYAVTRHPIYTGLLGMILGTALLAGLGQAILAVVAGLIVFAMKIHAEEQLLMVNFPGEYPAYRERVPQLVPGLGFRRRRRMHA